MSELKLAMVDWLGNTEPWNIAEKQGNPAEKEGNPADSAVVRGYIQTTHTEQRRVGVTVLQAPPMLFPCCFPSSGICVEPPVNWALPKPA